MHRLCAARMEAAGRHLPDQVACNGACNGYLLVVGFSCAGLSFKAKIAEVARRCSVPRSLLRDERKMSKDKIDFADGLYQSRARKMSLLWLRRTHVNTSYLVMPLNSRSHL